VRPADKKGKVALHLSRDPAGDYRAKTSYEISVVSRRMKESGHPAPLGDPTSGVVVVVEQPVGPRLLQALNSSLKAVGLPETYVTYTSTGLLAEEILAAEPHVLVALGPGAAREIDGLGHPLAQTLFSEAERGVWFAWTKGTAGLSLPSLAPALDDDAAKRSFWLAFQALRDLTPPYDLNKI
jgi:hypothetical protein